MHKLTWYAKQIVPMTYRTEVGRNGAQHFIVWKMWLGRCYRIDDRVLAS